MKRRGLNYVIKEYEKALEIIRERNVKLNSIILASALGALSEFGALNQGTVGLVAEHIAPEICAWMKTSNALSEDSGIHENLSNLFKTFGLAENNFKLKVKDNEVEVSIRTEKCPFDPTVVGKAEMPGTLCPVPFIISICLEILTQKTWNPKIERKGAHFEVVKKENGWCSMRIVRAE